MRGRRLTPAVLVVLVVAAVILASVQPALAGTGIGSGDGSVSDGTITATATSGSTGSSSSGAWSGTGGAKSPPPTCVYVPVPPALEAVLAPGGPGPGAWYEPSCETTILSTSQVWIPAGTPVAGLPSVPGLVQQALGQAALDDPTIVLNPPGDQVTNLASWLAIQPSQWGTVIASASAGGVTATVTATPEAVVWNLGDGDSVTCPGPGVLYDPNEPASDQSTYCSYVWPQSSANAPGGVFQVTATIEYLVTATVSGAPNPTPNLGVHAGPTQTMDVVVSEIEALGTSS